MSTVFRCTVLAIVKEEEREDKKSIREKEKRVEQPIAYAGYSYKVLILNIFRFISLLLFGGPEKDRCFL